jgi:hypothetical protein
MLDAFLWLLLLKNQKIKRDKNQFYRLFGVLMILMSSQKSSCQMNLEKVMQLDL